MRWIVWLLLGCVGFLVAAWLFPRSPAQPASPSVATPFTNVTEPIAQQSTSGPSGRADVIDGDSMRVGGVEVRLYGIDAPEGVQTCVTRTGESWPCGQQASQALRGLVEGHHLVCDERDVDAYGRVVAVCRRGGTNVNAWLVENGWALAYRRHSLAYIVQESAAETGRRGIWKGQFDAPWDWRARGRQRSAGSWSASNADNAPDAVQLARPDGASDRQTARCNIKGNVSQSSGTRFYHMPGDRDYQRTRISTGRGEWWFCSEAAARAAGWRRAGPAGASNRQKAGCNIKGNVSHNGGKRLYHMPGDPDYQRTQISAGRGERWFCSESEARAAGWRRAGT